MFGDLPYMDCDGERRCCVTNHARPRASLGSGDSLGRECMAPGLAHCDLNIPSQTAELKTLGAVCCSAQRINGRSWCGCMSAQPRQRPGHKLANWPAALMMHPPTAASGSTVRLCLIEMPYIRSRQLVGMLHAGNPAPEPTATLLGTCDGLHTYLCSVELKI